MRDYIVRRIVWAVATIWFISIGVFVLLRVSPGDPALLQQGVNATPEKVAAVRKELGLDKPLPVQYLRWVGNALQGDLGRSGITQVSVTSEFKSRFPVSLQLMMMTLVWVALFGVTFGAISARWQNSGFDYGVRLFAIFGLSVPAFWVATLVMLIPAQYWHYAPPSLGKPIAFLDDPIGNMQQFLPASLVLALGPTATVMRLTRSTLLEVLRQDYIRTARSKGLGERMVLWRHALRNSLIPVVTVLGLLAAGLLGGSVIIEQIFALRGLGLYIFQALLQKDYPVAQSIVLYTAAAVVFMNLAVDVVYAVLDPRIRYT
ncbi:MAG TPA: ABC transporter permease [Dehalococcoidia bacterium]|nr:ABC transporter permease [Dehalococcoidia bacterium]